MAATYTVRSGGEGVHSSKVPGAYFDDIFEVTAGSGDYLAGGYTFTIAQVQAIFSAGMLIESVEVADHWRTAAGGGTVAYLAVWDAVNNKVQAYGMGASAVAGVAFVEVPNANANINGLRCSLRVRWR